MKPKLSLLIFIVLVPVQLFVPASMIMKQETVLHKGREYKLRTQPVDPYDAFRGRYIRLSVESSEVAISESQRKTGNLKAYALMGTDAEGFGYVREVTFETPEENAYLQVRLNPSSGGKAMVVWPFERYYMEEFKAPKAEIIYQSRSNDSKAHITVRIYKGTGAITGLYVDDMTIEQKIMEKE